MGTYAKAFTYSVVIVNDIQQQNALWKCSNYCLHHLIIERQHPCGVRHSPSFSDLWIGLVSLKWNNARNMQ